MKVKSLKPNSETKILEDQKGSETILNIDGKITKKIPISFICIEPGRYYEDDESPHPLHGETEKFYKRNFYFKHTNHYVYSLCMYGKIDSVKYRYIALTWLENQRFLWMQKNHWVQEKDNIMWLVNIFVAILAVVGALKPSC